MGLRLSSFPSPVAETQYCSRALRVSETSSCVEREELICLLFGLAARATLPHDIQGLVCPSLGPSSNTCSTFRTLTAFVCEISVGILY